MHYRRDHSRAPLDKLQGALVAMIAGLFGAGVILTVLLHGGTGG